MSFNLGDDLPFASKKNKRKKQRLCCGECGSIMNLLGRRYVCPECGGAHLAHPDGTPTGVPPNKKTGEARKRAHRAFDKLWQSGKVTREEAYRILRTVMGLSFQEAHFGRFTKKQCEFLICKLEELGDKIFEPPYHEKI